MFEKIVSTENIVSGTGLISDERLENISQRIFKNVGKVEIIDLLKVLKQLPTGKRRYEVFKIWLYTPDKEVSALLSGNEIARRLKITPNAVYVHLQACFKLVRSIATERLMKSDPEFTQRLVAYYLDGE